jgi:hypothetical protein
MKEVQLQRRTRPELLALAGKAKVQGRHRMTKDQLMRAIRSRAATASRSRRRRKSALSGTGASGRVTAEPCPVFVKQEQPGLKELTELPSSYGQTRLTLMGIDPFWIHAYWEVTPHDHEVVMAQLGSERASADWALRFYDVTYIDFNGTNAHSYFDQPVDLAAGSWYVNLWSSEKTYCADIGARGPTGRFESACRSNFVRTPRADESPHYRPEWLRVDGVFENVERVTLSPPSESRGIASEPPASAQSALLTAPGAHPRSEREPVPPAAETDIGRHFGRSLPLARATGAGEPATARKQTDPAGDVPQNTSSETQPGAAWHEVRGRYWRTLGGFGNGSWAPSGVAAADLKSNAEVNPSSHVQPNQSCGRPVVPARK